MNGEEDRMALPRKPRPSGTGAAAPVGARLSGDVTVVGFTEPIDIDSTSAATLEDRIIRCLIGPPLVVLDMTSVGFVDSDGMDLLIDLHHRLREQGGALVLSGVGRAVSEVFALAGLDCLLTIAADEETASRAVRREAASAEIWH